MASPAVTYTFSNSTTADATQVNQNFTDVINGITDGTKDLSISALTVAGNASFSGNTTLGNASGDDITFTGSMASSIPIKTTNTYDIGSSTLGLRAAYLGANSQTVKLVGSASMSATWTFTFPTTAGSANQFLKTDGSGVTSWETIPTEPFQIANLGISATVGSSALTIAMKQSDGSTDPATGSGAVRIGMRSSTAATGSYTQRTVTSALSLVVSSGSTLGQTSGKQAYLWVYAIDSDGSGSIKLGVSQTRFPDGSVQSTTAEGGAGAADSATVLYSDSAYTDKPIRLIARIKNTQGTAGTWATTPSEVVLCPAQIAGDRVSFSATTSGGVTLAPNGSAATVNFNSVSGTALEDTHSGFDTSAYIYYVPVSGNYYISSVVYVTATNVLANDYGLRIYVDGALYRVGNIQRAVVGTAFAVSIATMIPGLRAGQTVRIDLFGVGNNSVSTLTSDSGYNTMSFTGFRIGDL